MRRGPKAALLVALTLALLGGGGMLAWMGAQAFFCDNHIVREEKAPGGRLRAVLFTRSCFLDSSPNFQLSVVEQGSSLRDYETANIFIGEREFGFRWKSERELEVDGLPAPFRVTETFYGFDIQ